MNAAKGAFFGGALIALGVLVGDWLPADNPLGRGWPWFVVAGVLVLVWVVVESIVNRTLWRVVLFGLAFTALGVWFAGWVPVATPGQAYWPWGLFSGLLLLGGSAAFGSRSGSSGLVAQWSRKSRRNDGVASFWAIQRVASAFAMRRKAKVLRPSLAELSWWRRWRTSIREFATPLARVGLARVWSAVEDITVRIGGPRTGKTGELAGRILDAPGAVIATSTRTDLIDLTAGKRSKKGPIRVFNPAGLGGLESTITFDPLAGCGDPTVATTRAADLLAGVSAPGSGGDREFWAGQARRVLSVLMHAAALGGLSMRDVMAWVADPGSDDVAREIDRLLSRSSQPSYATDAVQFLNTNDRTRSSICSTIMPALGWLTDENASKAAAPGPDGRGFDVQALLNARGTVYMLGAEEAQSAPLVTALTGHIAREARRIAEDMGGRLDPPLTLALDEAALICPIPLDQWTADMGGRNITIHIAAQSRAQLRQRWGDTGAATILNNAATLLIFGGARDADDLNSYSLLTGTREETVHTLDADGHLTTSSTRPVPVLSPAQISQLPAKKVLIIRRGMAPAVGTAQMAWERHDVRQLARAERWAPRFEKWAATRNRWATRAVEAFQALAVKLEPLMDRMSRTPTSSKPVDDRTTATEPAAARTAADEHAEGWTR